MAEKLEKLGPTQFQAEIDRLTKEGKLPALDEVLGAVADARKKYAHHIITARHEDKGE
jgi:hypothetical protein